MGTLRDTLVYTRNTASQMLEDANERSVYHAQLALMIWNLTQAIRVCDFTKRVVNSARTRQK